MRARDLGIVTEQLGVELFHIFGITLDLRDGVLTRVFRVRDAQGRITRVSSRRLVHMGKPNLAALKWELIAENWSGEAVVRTGIDGSVINNGVPRYRQLSSKHLEIQERSTVAPEGIYLKARTSQSHVEIAMAARPPRCSSAWR